MKTKALWAAVVAALMVVGSSGVLAAGGIPSAEGVFTACYNEGGNVKLLPTGITKCPKGWTGPVYWNAQGQPGEQGPEGGQGPPGAPGNSEGSEGTYVDFQANNSDEEKELLVDHQDYPEGVLLESPLPEGYAGFFVAATFTLINYGELDAHVNCSVGNRMGHELFVPFNQLSAPDLGGSAAGVWTQDASTFTLTGLADGSGSANLTCFVIGWQSKDDSREAPLITMRRGSLETIALGTLNGSGAAVSAVSSP